MASIIRIKRSTGVAAPSSLKTGEIAYTYGAGTSANLGDRLFFGKGDDGNGTATSVVVIGGEYFANLADHTPGTLTASSALIVDGNSKIDTINVDNITIDGNTISSTDTNGNVTIDPNGSGVVDVSTSRIVNVSTPTAGTDAATKSYVDNIVGGDAINLAIAGDTGTGTITLADSDLTISGGTGIETSSTDTEITVTLSDTAVSPASYGSATNVPVITVDQQGRITAASTAAISTTLTTAAESGTGSVSLIDSSLEIAAGEGINTTASGNTITIAGEDASTSNKGIASFSADNFDVASGVVTIKDGGVANAELANSSITISGETISLGDSATLSTTNITEGDNLYYTTARADSDAKNAISVTDAGGDGSLTYNAGTGVLTYTGPSATETRAHLVAGTGVGYDSASGVISIGQAVGTNDNVSFNDVVVQGNLQVTGTTTTVNSQTLEVTDNMIYMNAGESDGSPTQFVDVGWAANVNETGTYAHVGMFRDATDGTFKIYDGYLPEPDSDVQINTGHASFNLAPLAVGTITGQYLGFDSDFTAKSTSDLSEGTNLYYTTARADSDAKNAISGGTGISYNPATGVITTDDGAIVHDSLSGFVADEHIDHSSVTITAGSGLTGGGDITATRTLNVGAGTGITVNADDIAVDMSAFTTTNLTEGDNLYYTDERVDDRLSSLLLAGEGIDLTYVDNNGGPGALTIAAELATTANPGVANFDSDQMSVTAGLVSITEIDGGTF